MCSSTESSSNRNPPVRSYTSCLGLTFSQDSSPLLDKSYLRGSGDTHTLSLSKNQTLAYLFGRGSNRRLDKFFFFFFFFLEKKNSMGGRSNRGQAVKMGQGAGKRHVGD
jgi:hypothetical protein